MALVVARFQYALPALAGQLSADDLRKVDAVFNKARRWQLTSHTPYSADLIEQCDKHLFRATINPAHCLYRILPPAALNPTQCLYSILPPATLNPTHCLYSILPPKKNMYGRNLRKKGHGRELPMAKTKLYKDSFLIRCIYKYVWLWLQALHRERTFDYYYCPRNYNFDYNFIYGILSIFYDIVLFCIFFYSKHLLCNCVRLSY